MIKITNSNLYRFKQNHTEYLFYVKNGIFLAFDKDTLEYIGIELYCFPNDINKIQKMCDEKLEFLINHDILEYVY